MICEERIKLRLANKTNYIQIRQDSKLNFTDRSGEKVDTPIFLLCNTI